MNKRKPDNLIINDDSSENTREEFRKFFVGLKRKLGLAPELENVLWLHLKATGMDKKEKFNEGVKHFGYKI